MHVSAESNGHARTHTHTHTHTHTQVPLCKMQLELHRCAEVTITEIPKKEEAMPGGGHGRRDGGWGAWECDVM